MINEVMMKKNSLLFLLLLVCYSCTAPQSESTVKDAPVSQQYLPVIAIHGGAGNISKEHFTPELEQRYRQHLTHALTTGYSVLQQGGTSIDAVINTIQILEQDSLFNAGIGAVLTHDEKAELDASIMDGANGLAGAVAGVSRVRSPIAAAKAVMLQSKHVLLTGAGAEQFAEEQGLEMVPPGYFITERRLRQLRKLKAKTEQKKDTNQLTSALFEGVGDKFGTVGAVALDQKGNLAAGTSTGGMTNKRFGRVGDSPIIGAGTYADNLTCAVSATGHGEYFIRNVVAYDIAARMKYQGVSLDSAAHGVITSLKKKDGLGGVIALDRNGNIALPFNTAGMFRGSVDQNGAVTIELFGVSEMQKH